MSTHNPDKSNRKPEHKPQPVDVSKGYEASDVHALGIVIAILAFGLFAVVSGVVGFEIGKSMNARMARQNGPPNKWSHPADLRSSGNMASNPTLQSKIAGTTEQFPTPRLQIDDGLQDLAELHAREDLLLNNYSWVDQAQGKVRIPIERAMELIAQSGLPVAPQATEAPRLTGDIRPEVAIPLTNGFAQTGYEQNVAQAQAVKGR
jgi:hypothetical protein